MQFALSCLTAMVACTVFAGVAFAQSARDFRGPSPLVAIENEPPAMLIVDPPLAEQLAQGLALQLLSLWTSKSMGNHDSNVMGGADSVD